jgi:predicted transcriptional regulator
MNSLFDDQIRGATNPSVIDKHSPEQSSAVASDSTTADYLTDNKSSENQSTATSIKTAVQELLKFGVLEAERKPNLYQITLTQQAAMDQILEPFDLAVKIDSVRGLAILVVAPTFVGDDDNDEWSHPLVRRQRLTLEQSLLVALLRQIYVLHEQEQGIGAGGALVHVDDLIPQVQVYLGDLGSDAREQKRLRTLLDHLKNHAVVSDINEQDQFLIRPIITHLADPASLTNLLQHFRTRAQGNHRNTAAPEQDE